MTEPAAVEAQVTGKEGHLLGCVEIAKDLLLIGLLWAPHLKADLSEVDAPSAGLFGLALRDVVVQNDHAAVLVFARTSFTTPRRVRVTASRAAAGLMTPRYSRAIASAG